jgi:hypothetical protein
LNSWSIYYLSTVLKCFARSFCIFKITNSVAHLIFMQLYKRHFWSNLFPNWMICLKLLSIFVSFFVLALTLIFLFCISQSTILCYFSFSFPTIFEVLLDIYPAVGTRPRISVCNWHSTSYFPSSWVFYRRAWITKSRFFRNLRTNRHLILIVHQSTY